MDAPVTCDACGEERRRSARIVRIVCITLRFADFSLREGAERFLCDSARFCQLLLRIWRWPDHKSDALAGPAFFDAAGKGIQDTITSVRYWPLNIRTLIVVMLCDLPATPPDSAAAA